MWHMRDAGDLNSYIRPTSDIYIVFMIFTRPQKTPLCFRGGV